MNDNCEPDPATIAPSPLDADDALVEPPQAAGFTAAEAEGSRHWRQNLFVSLFGSFTTVVGMTLLLPFLPLYVERLGVSDQAAIVQWSGAVYGATFLTAGLAAPVWGHLADRYGRKIMLIRASLGMAVAMSLMGFVQTVWQLLALRLVIGLVGGYSSGSNVLVATQSPRNRTGWALGTLAAGIMAGNLVGPLIGGVLPQLVGMRETFFLVGAVIFVAFLATVLMIREDRRPAAQRKAGGGGWGAVPDKRPVLTMLGCGFLLMLANMSIEPIITVYVATLVPEKAVTAMAGLVMSAAALGSILSASRLGRLADRIGHWTVIAGCLAASAALLVPQAFVTAGWQLIALRFLMGLALGGLLPCITSVIRHNVPERSTGAILGYAISSQYAGQVLGPLGGGFVGGHIGMRAVFLGTALMMAVGALAVRAMRPDGTR
jgi:MFS family permease